MLDIKEIYARIEGINNSDSQINLLVTTVNGDKVNLKTDLALKSFFTVNSIYKFKIVLKHGSERDSLHIQEYAALDMNDYQTLDKIYRVFLPSAPLNLEDLEAKITEYISKIGNKIIRDITKKLVDENKGFFFVYPAAVKLHHAYVGGLAYHTISMLKLADSFLITYPFLNKDYLYSGVILHDLGKIIEFSSVENPEYTLDGQLLGHLVIGSQMVYKAAHELNYGKTEEALLLQHLVIAHHGQQTFGSPKKPMIAEALLLWYVDTIDSKFVVLEEELSKTQNGCFTEQIGILDRVRFYNPNHKE